MSDWTTASLPDVLEFREGPGIMARDFRSDGTPLIRLAGLKRGASLLEGANYLDPAAVEKRWKQFRLQLGDTLLSTSASLGEVARVGKEGVGAIPYTGIISFRPRDGRIDPTFIPHMLTTRSFVNQIQAMGVGSVMKHFGPSHLRHMTLAFPSRPAQVAIAEVLAAFDEKVAVNQRRLALADELNRALVARASTQGEYATLRDLMRLHYGKALPAGLRRPGAVVVFGSGGPTGSHDVALVNGPGIVLGRKGTVGAVYWADGPHYPIDTTYFVEPLVEGTAEVLFYVLRTVPFAGMNSDSAVPGLNREEAYSCTVRVPLNSQALASELRIEFAAAAAVRREIASLTSTRDELLQLLMSGKVRVKDAEKALEEVL